MRILVPVSGASLSAIALDGALAAARTGDVVIVAAAIVAPSGMSPDTPTILRRMHRAERALAAARAATDMQVPPAVDVCFVASRAHARADTTIAAARQERADVIVLAARRGLLGAFVAWWAAVRLLQRGAPCPVRLVSAGGGERRDAPQ